MCSLQLTEPLLTTAAYDEWADIMKRDKRGKMTGVRELVHGASDFGYVGNALPEMEEIVLKHMVLFLHRHSGHIPLDDPGLIGLSRYPVCVLSGPLRGRRSLATSKSLAELWGPIFMRPEGFRSDAKGPAVETIAFLVSRFTLLIYITLS